MPEHLHLIITPTKIKLEGFHRSQRTRKYGHAPHGKIEKQREKRATRQALDREIAILP
jgi:hypothetical protein